MDSVDTLLDQDNSYLWTNNEARLITMSKVNDCATKEEKSICYMRGYLLQSIDDEERNVLHIACMKGNPKLIEYICK